MQVYEEWQEFEEEVEMAEVGLHVDAWKGRGCIVVFRPKICEMVELTAGVICTGEFAVLEVVLTLS